jgi:16S rRNA (cytosine1402-N4)-methyltransferase
MKPEAPHIPVMLRQTMELLRPEPGKIWVDATAGAGGHLREIIRRGGGAGSTIVAIDQDPASLQSLENAIRSEFQGNGADLRFAHSNFRNLERILDDNDIDTVTGGILADLGVSSMQLDQPERGFSFTKDGPLDMRMDTTSGVTAERLVNTLPENELADIIYKYGEERLSRQIAHRIVESRPIKTTAQLASVVSPVVLRRRGGGKHRDESHPATRTFQALRIAVNDELGSVEQLLRAGIKRLAPGARIVLITFHSLEDRIVKQILREGAAYCICPPRLPVCTCNKRKEIEIITSKPLLPDHEEVLANPRSRSAKLRAGEKVA